MHSSLKRLFAGGLGLAVVMAGTLPGQPLMPRRHSGRSLPITAHFSSQAVTAYLLEARLSFFSNVEQRQREARVSQWPGSRLLSDTRGSSVASYDMLLGIAALLTAAVWHGGWMAAF